MKRNILQRFTMTIFVIIQMFVSLMIPVHAASVTMDLSGITIMADSFPGGHLMMKTYQGLPAYCVLPRVEYTTDDVYDVDDFETYDRLSAITREHIAEYSYFGYGYSNRTDVNYFAATQYLIWLEIDETFVVNVRYYDENTGEDITSAVEQCVEEIVSSVVEYQKETDFTLSGALSSAHLGNTYYGSGESGDTFIFDDTAGALHQMVLTQNDFGNALSFQEDKVTITLSPSTSGDCQAKFRSNTETIGERPLALVDSNGVYQSFFVRGDITKTAMIQLHTSFASDFNKLDNDGNVVSGAAMKLYDKTSQQVIEQWVSSESAHHVSGLEGNHSYILSEEDTPLGYYYGSEKTFHPLQSTSSNIIDEKIHCQLLKVNTDGKPVENAVLQIVDNQDGRSMQVTTRKEPLDCGSFLKAGHSYTVKELQAPVGYYYAQDITFTVSKEPSETIQISIKDEPIQYEITKKDENGKSVKGASLSLFDVNGNEKQLIQTWITGIEPIEIGNFLQAGHSYCVAENDASTKYFLAVDQNFMVSKYAENQESHVITITDNHIHYVLQKVDENGKAVKDARLVVTDITDPLDADRVVLDWRSTEEPLIVNLFERGHTYLLKEIESPDGYYQAEEQVFVVPTYGSAEPIVITCEDAHIVYRFNKVDVDGNAVMGAELKLFEKTTTGEVEIKTFTSGEEATTVYGLMNNRDYVLRETMTPDGYYTAKDILFHVNQTGTSEPITISMVDRQIEASIRKVNTKGKLVAGAVLSLKDETSGEHIMDFTTDDEQDMIIGHLLKEGHTYSVEEIEAPNGYYFTKRQLFTVQEGNDIAIEVVMVDENIEKNVQKQDLQGNALVGATLALVHDNEELVRWISDGNAYDLSSYLHAGWTYEIVEIESPQGFYVTSPITFSVAIEAPEKNEDVIVKNIPINYEIIKTDEKGNPISGVQLKLTDITNEDVEVIAQWTTEEEAKKFSSELIADHQYLLEETAIIAGFHEAASMTFQINKQGMPQTMTIHMIDETNDLSIIKTDEKGFPLAGAEIEIQDSEGNVITSFLSDDSLDGVSLNREGKKLSSYLLSGKTYILHEKKAPFGYEVCTDQTFVMNGTTSSPQLISLMDQPKTMYVRVDKRSAEGNMPFLEGCEVAIFNVATDEPVLSIRGEQAIALTGDDGRIDFELPYTSDGYYVKETKAPQGFMIDDSHKNLVNDQEDFFHDTTPQEVHIVDEKTVDTSTELPYHAIMALLCVMGCFYLMQLPHDKA